MPKEHEPTFLSTVPRDWIDLFTLTACDYLVISGSTFGIWGALMANTPHVVRPDKIYGPIVAAYTDSELIFPKEWKSNPMLMNLDELAAKYGLVSKVIGILHGGAHLAEEAPDYARVFPAAPIWWIEANTAVTPQIIAVITKYENQKLIEALLCDVDNEHRQFNITNYDGMSSSLLEFGTHPEFSPDTVFTHSVSLATRTLDH